MTRVVNIAQSGGNNVTMRNKIINGAMMIDQRNAGAATTINSGAHTYTVDRWSGSGQSADGVFTVQQSAVAPVGFVNSLLATVTTADASIGASQFYVLRQAIEGFNIADWGWGTANAQSVTLSFWVRSSLTGAFSGAVTTGAYNRAYPFSFTINAANTYEYKTITIAGDTSGTWATNNTAGLFLYFDLGSGSNNKGTAGVWAGSGLVGVTGSVNLIGTSGATFYITGVQLEAGTTATPFEQRLYGTELALCQRYYYKVLPGAIDKVFNSGYAGSGTSARLVSYFPVTMRTAPAALEQTGTASDYSVYIAAGEVNCSSVPTYSSFTTADLAYVNFTASSMTSGDGVVGITNSTTAYLAWSAEL